MAAATAEEVRAAAAWAAARVVEGVEEAEEARAWVRVRARVRVKARVGVRAKPNHVWIAT